MAHLVSIQLVSVAAAVLKIRVIFCGFPIGKRVISRHIIYILIRSCFASVVANDFGQKQVRKCSKHLRLRNSNLQNVGILRPAVTTHFMHFVCQYCIFRCCVLQLQGALMIYVRTLTRVMPKVCKLLRYDYGSPGELRVASNFPRRALLR